MPFRSLAALLPLLTALFLLGGCSSDEITPPEPGPVWVTFKRPETPALLTNAVNTLHSDGSGRVWVGSDSGANYYYHGSWGIIRDSLRFNQGGGARYQVNA